MRRALIFLGSAVVLGGVGFLSYSVWAKAYSEPTVAEVEVELVDTRKQIVDQVLEQRAEQIKQDPSLEFTANEITVLLIGLDTRKDQDNPHCDAIHFFTFDLEDWSILITSIPRGTYSALPPGGTYEPTQYYVSNACGFGGIDYGISQIEKISGLRADYVVTVGFSQAMGVFRLLNLPATETLQWLRHRQSYSIGDPQRSHNQALFMKDMIVAHINDFESDLTAPLQYVFFTTISTDMEFSLARALLKGYLAADIASRPEDIRLQMIPYHQTVDYHYDQNSLEEDLQQKIDFMQPLLTQDDLTGRSKEEIQAELVAFLEDRLVSEESVADVVAQELWLQVEEEQVREQFEFAYAERYFEELKLTDQAAAVKYMSDYILEQQALGNETYIEQAKRDLENIVE